MLNILIPLAGKSIFFDSYEYPFPKPLIEIGGKLMIELVIENLNQINRDKQFIFIVNENDCYKYHLDNILRLLTDNNCVIIKLKNETKGAACSCLMAIDYINNENPLVISNGDQVIDEDLNSIILGFEKSFADAATICFESVHPKWSYVREDGEGNVVETAEKRPISKNAIAGFYYFKKGQFFVQAAMQSIMKDAHVNGQYYIAPTFNELILQNKIVAFRKIDKERYHSFYSPQKIKEYEKKLFYDFKFMRE